MGKIALSIMLVLAIIYIIPFLVYGVFSAIAGLKLPEGASPLKFLVSVFVSKVGTAIAFVLIFYLARDSLSGQWLLYAFIWWLMFVIGEVGQARAKLHLERGHRRHPFRNSIFSACGICSKLAFRIEIDFE